MKEISVLGIDLAKSVFELHGQDKKGKVVLRKSVTRKKLLSVMANIPPCLVGMEACSGANYWAREFSKLGHEARIMAPQYTKPFSKSKKNDPADAEGICEAVQRPTMPFVSAKTVEQQDIQAVHRLRQRVVKDYTAILNQARGLLAEYGIVVPKGPSHIERYLKGGEFLEDSRLSKLFQGLLSRLSKELKELASHREHYEKLIGQIHRAHPECQRLEQICGIGPLTATAALCVIGDPADYKNGRQFAASVGLVPRQNSSGGKQRLSGITKQGDRYLRTLLIHGSRATLRFAERRNDSHGRWLVRLKERRGFNRAAVADANKKARIIWAVLKNGTSYDPALAH